MSKKEHAKIRRIKLHKGNLDHVEQMDMRLEQKGEVIQLVYLKMLLKSVDTGNVIYFQGIKGSIEEELSFDLCETMEDVNRALDYLKAHNMIEIETEP